MNFNFKLRATLVLMLILTSSLVGLIPCQAQTNKKIGFADFGKLKHLMPEYDSLVALSAEYESLFEKELYALTNMIQEKSKQLDTIIGQSEKDKLIVQLQDLTSMLNSYRITAKIELSKTDHDLFIEVNQRIADACERIKDKDDFDYIYDSSLKAIPPMIGAKDLTEVIAKELGLDK